MKGKTLGRPGHRIAVHPVAACSHDAPETGRTKLQVLIETILDFLAVIGDGYQLGQAGRVHFRI